MWLLESVNKSKCGIDGENCLVFVTYASHHAIQDERRSISSHSLSLEFRVSACLQGVVERFALELRQENLWKILNLFFKPHHLLCNFHKGLLGGWDQDVLRIEDLWTVWLESFPSAKQDVASNLSALIIVICKGHELRSCKFSLFQHSFKRFKNSSKVNGLLFW